MRLIRGAGSRRLLAEPLDQKGSSQSDSGTDVCSKSSSEEHGSILEEPEELLEPWSEWIKRVTHFVELQMDRLHIRSWVVNAREQKLQMASRIAMHPATRWTAQALRWDPATMFDGLRPTALRKRARPAFRWAWELSIEDSWTRVCLGLSGGLDVGDEFFFFLQIATNYLE